MRETGKTAYIAYRGRTIEFLNQRSRAWTHPYEYAPHPGGTLTNSGCGIFSTCMAAQWMSGKRPSPEALADFSVREGGRGDDGTDRPALLSAMQHAGLCAEYGFEYRFEGLLNDPALLWENLRNGGCALCNLRVGHIVTLIDARVKDGEKQVLALDCHSESGDARVSAHVREVLPGTLVCARVANEAGVSAGYVANYALFWVPLSLPMDFNLLRPLKA